jgi:hypothetical protein
MRLELRRQAADRELGRLRLLAGTAMVGWIASIGMLGIWGAVLSTTSRVTIATGSLLLLGALASAFTAQRRLVLPNGEVSLDTGPAGSAALWLLIAGLAFAALSLVLRGL